MLKNNMIGFKDVKHIALRTLIAAILVGVMSSCSGEFSVAQKYVNQHRRGSKKITEKIYVCLPREVLHTNSNLNEILDFAYLSIAQQDSVIRANTTFLNRVDDSIFLSQFSGNLLYILSKFDVPVILVPDAGSLPKPDSEHFTLNIVQIEAEEFTTNSRSDFYTKKGAYYHYDYPLHHFSTNVWYSVNATDSAENLYFKSFDCADSFSGVVTSLKDNKATLKGKFNRINMNDIYGTATAAGYRSGVYFIEKMILDHVKSVNGKNEGYFFYYPEVQDIMEMVPVEEGLKDSFQPLK